MMKRRIDSRYKTHGPSLTVHSGLETRLLDGGVISGGQGGEEIVWILGPRWHQVIGFGQKEWRKS